MVRPKTYDDELRAALVAQTAERIATVGHDGLSLREIAAATGTSTNAIYTIFGGKTELVDAVVRHADTSLAAVQARAARDGRTVADLRRLGYSYRAWSLANPALYEIMFGHRSLARGRAALPPHSAEPPESMRPALRVVGNLIASGHVRDAGGPLPVATSIWATTHGIVSLEIAVWAGTPMADAMFTVQMDAIERGWHTPLGQQQALELRAAGDYDAIPLEAGPGVVVQVPAPDPSSASGPGAAPAALDHPAQDAS